MFTKKNVLDFVIFLQNYRKTNPMNTITDEKLLDAWTIGTSHGSYDLERGSERFSDEYINSKQTFNSNLISS